MITLNAKEYLSQVQEKERQVKKQEDYIARLKETLDVAGVRYDKEVVQSSPEHDPMAKVFSKICEEEKKLEELRKDYVDYKISVVDKIFQIENELYRDVLDIVYINGASLRNCAEMIEYSYEYIRKIHSQALSYFEEKYKSCIENTTCCISDTVCTLE